MQKHHNMTFDEIVKEVVRVCKNNKVEHLSLFGSYARGTQTERSDIDFATGSPRDTLKTAYSVGLISDDLWLQMLKVRNTLIHDYDGDVVKRYFKNITEDFFELLQQLRSKAEQWYQVDESDGR